MSTVKLENVSHSRPEKFRIRYNDAMNVLGPKPVQVPPSAEPALVTKSLVAIIGAGFGGMAGLLTCLQKLQLEDVVVFEKHDNFGGTWYANTYPGCASDIPALWYSLYGELNKSWSELQPPQYEMEEYMMEVVKKHNLQKYGRFETIVQESVYNEKDGVWNLHGVNVKTGRKFKHTCKILVSARGGLVYPKQLDAPGLDNFKGTYVHSALWDHNLSFKGKNVVVVGNGCSACQLVPALLKDYEPKHLTQLARSKQYVHPPLPSAVYWLYKLLSFSRLGMMICRFIVVAFAESRFPMFKGNGYFARFVRWTTTLVVLRYMKKTCPPEYYDVILPDFKIGCKRLIFDKQYLPCLHDKRMDVRGNGIKRIEEHHVVLDDNTRLPADIIVACTGYDLEKGFNSDAVIGRNGFDLRKNWNKEGVSAYETIFVKNCPNYFFLGGPNSATGHSSVVMAIENACTYFSKVAPRILSGEVKSVVVKDEKYDEWFKMVQRDLKNAVFGTPFGGCTSWYTKNNINFTAYPYSQLTYWWRMRSPKWEDLEVVKAKQD